MNNEQGPLLPQRDVADGPRLGPPGTYRTTNLNNGLHDLRVSAAKYDGQPALHASLIPPTEPPPAPPRQVSFDERQRLTAAELSLQLRPDIFNTMSNSAAQSETSESADELLTSPPHSNRGRCIPCWINSVASAAAATRCIRFFIEPANPSVGRLNPRFGHDIAPRRSTAQLESLATVANTLELPFGITDTPAERERLARKTENVMELLSPSAETERLRAQARYRVDVFWNDEDERATATPVLEVQDMFAAMQTYECVRAYACEGSGETQMRLLGRRRNWLEWEKQNQSRGVFVQDLAAAVEKRKEMKTEKAMVKGKCRAQSMLDRDPIQGSDSHFYGQCVVGHAEDSKRMPADAMLWSFWTGSRTLDYWLQAATEPARIRGLAFDKLDATRRAIKAASFWGRPDEMRNDGWWEWMWQGVRVSQRLALDIVDLVGSRTV